VNHRSTLCVLVCVVVALQAGVALCAEKWDYKKQFLPYLIDGIQTILDSQNKETGGFGTQPWICTDQNAIYPLAAAWAIEDPDNQWYHNEEVLDAIMLGGDKLIAEQKPSGKWIFRKKDNSTWGDIYMPWTYSRWIRAYSLIKNAMPPDRRAKWEKGLKLGFDGIAREAMKEHLANIPCTDAMALYLAGKEFARPDWCEKATAYEHKVVDYQNPAGFWSEHAGPVVVYNQVYLDALGVYYSISHDEYVLPALQRASLFHTMMTYPDGSSVETVDERNGYHPTILMPNVGFTFSAVGRGLLKRQLGLRLKQSHTPISSDAAGTFILYGQEGDIKLPPDKDASPVQVLSDHNAMTRRSGEWFTGLSAYHTCVCTSRWIQDRQNLVSLFNDRVGLIVGGGNTKLQPLWSTFTLGDVSLLKHKPGDENPNFLPPPGLWHTPTDAALDVEKTRLLLEYNLTKCQVKVDLSDPKNAKIIYMTEGVSGTDDNHSNGPVAAHVPLWPHMGEDWKTASGQAGKLSNKPIHLTGAESGQWFQHHGWRIHLPKDAVIDWPVLPHDQYVKTGDATAKDGLIVITLPFDAEHLQQEVTVEIP
jgi:hypothetical protein